MARTLACLEKQIKQNKHGIHRHLFLKKIKVYAKKQKPLC